MSRTAPTVDLFVRTGFASASAPAHGAAPSIGVSARAAHSLGEAFYEMLPAISAATSDIILFADELVALDQPVLDAVNTAFHSCPDAVAVTADSDAFRKLHGLAGPSGHPSGTHHLAPWFTAIRRSFLREQGLLNYKYGTLEFFLCEISDRLTKTAGAVSAGIPFELGVDYRLWARDVLLTTAARMASDHHIFEASHRDHPVRFETPRQFRVAISGTYLNVNLPDDGGTALPPSTAPRFSVICPAYKAGFFADAVKSVMAQTWLDFEFIVVVDGPPHRDREAIVSVLDQYAADPRLRYYVQDNRGTGPTRRRLAELSKGDYVVSIDDDDMFHPDVLKVFAAAVEQHPGCAVFRGGAQLFGLVDAYLRPRQRAVVNGIPSDLFEATQPWAIKRAAIAALGGFDGDKRFGEAGEDSDLFLKIDLTTLETGLIDAPLYRRRLSTVNQTLQLSPDDCGNHVRSLLERHRPEQWRHADLHFERDGAFIRSAISYRSAATAQEVVTATRFFDYQTLGDDSDVLIDLEITSLCNAVCPFCPREVLDRKAKFIEMEVVDALAEQLKRATGRRQVILCGIGESTLNPKLPAIVQKLAMAGVKVCMTTNGGLMNVDKFKLLVDAGMAEFNFSLNAATAPTHQKVMKMKNFDKVMNNFAAILDYKAQHAPQIRIHASFVYCADNQHEVDQFVGKWRDTPVSQIWIHPVNGRAGLLGDDIRAVNVRPLQDKYQGDERVLVDVFSHRHEDGDLCKIVKDLDFISVDGDMLLCALDYKRSVALGNLKDTPLRELHLNKVLKYKRHEINEICHGCDFCPASGDHAARAVGESR
jgi:MoaA/NifB/PqqE/SkfB family radical SAM enzyme